MGSDQIVLTNRCGSSSAENTDCSHASDNLVTKSIVREVPDSRNRSQSGERSANTENETQADSGNAGVGERERGGNELMEDNGDNDQGIPLGRKRMGRPKRKKKKAYSAGIATYDSRTNTVRLKGSATETPAAVHDTEIKEPRQSSPRSSKCQPTEQGIQVAGVKSKWNAGAPEEIMGGRDFNLDNGSTGKSLGIEEAARLSRLLSLEDIDNGEVQLSPKLVIQDDLHREKSVYGGIVQQTLESNEANPSQSMAVDTPEVALKNRPVKNFPGAKRTLKTQGFEQNSKSVKWETNLKDVDVQAAASNEVDPRKDITENSQVNLKSTLTRKSWKSGA